MIFAGSIYHFEIPAFLKPYIQSDAMQRLKQIDMNCGMNFTSFPLFCNIEAYSRFHHSLGCALIVWHFTHDERQTLAALFHDIATPVFSHVIDFLYGDHLNQESTEKKTADIIRNDRAICAQLYADGICFEDVSDYHLYPIADNDSPRLCADRLEYIFGDLLDYRFTDEETLRRIYEDITVKKNAEGMDELSFLHEQTAAKFALYALKCGRIYSGDENRYAMEYLAGLLRDALALGIITEKDFYTCEKDVLLKLEKSCLCERLDFFRHMNHVIHTDAEDPCGLMVDAKKRWIDPLCMNGKRISELDETVHEEIRAFRQIDYHYHMKGIIQ